MSSRRFETALAWFTCAFLAIYAPLETLVSWSYGLTSPYYLVDLVAMLVLAAGVVRSLRSRPRSSAALLTAGWGWAAANFWRATLDRFEATREGETLQFGPVELTLAYCITALAVVCFVVGIWLVSRSAE
jgi:hypothetical protein